MVINRNNQPYARYDAPPPYYYPPPPPRRHSFMPLLYLVGIVVIGLIALQMMGMMGGITAGVSNFFATVGGGGEKRITVDTSSTAVVQQVRAMNRWEGATYTIEKVITAYQKADFLDSLYGGKVLFVAHADVVAGIDLSAMSADSVTVSIGVSDTRRVRIWLPSATVFNTTLDEKKSYVYSAETNSMFGRLNPQIFDMVRSAAQDEVSKAAIEQGILGDARAAVERDITNLLGTLGFAAVTFR